MGTLCYMMYYVLNEVVVIDVKETVIDVKEIGE